MPSKEYYEGREMETNVNLHKYLIEKLNFDYVESDGSSSTKTDVLGIKDGKQIPLSVKYVSGKNTQVHLTTLNKLSNDLNMPQDIKSLLDLWLGSKDGDWIENVPKQIKLTDYEIKHQRLKSSNIESWSKVEDWFNEMNKKDELLELLIQSLKKDASSKYLVWINKKTNNIEILYISKLIEYIKTKCKWITMPSGTVLRCINPEGKPILWLQMKGNKEDYGYNHSPQFHIASNWPKELLIQ